MIWAAAGAVVGLAAGTALSGEVYRMSVRSGEPDQAACRECGAPLPAWTARRCRHCGQWLGAALVTELTTAMVMALLFGRFGGQPVVAAFAFLGAVGVALAQVDAAVQRLPDRLTLPAYPAVIALLAGAAVADHAGSSFARAVFCGLILTAAYLVLGIASRGQLGGGDVKLAGLIGLSLGWMSWQTMITGACLGFVLAAVAGLALLAAGRASRRSLISFGPFMLGGAFLALLGAGA